MSGMSTFRDVFVNPHIVLPVVHLETLDQALSNVEIAREAGADGVFLINHSIGWEQLLRIHGAVVDRFPEWWVGVNCLGLHPQELFSRISPRVSGVWVDNAMIDENRYEQPEAEAVLCARRESGWTGLYFGGVAFKYQREVGDVASAARRAVPFIDVVTTSGPGTGQAAHVEKIRLMKEALGTFPLAIASGITPANVRHYLPFADCYLVATGISKSFVDLDPALVRALVESVRCIGGNFGSTSLPFGGDLSI